MLSIRKWLSTASTLVVQALQAYGKLLKVMIPALLIVKLLQWMGAIDELGALLSPAMALVGLPDLLGIVWATTLMTNIFTGVLVFFEVAGELSLSVEQVTVLGSLMLIAHSLPVEGAVARRAGVPWWVTITLRVGGAMALAGMLHFIYSGFMLFQEPARFVWQPEVGQATLSAWFFSQIKALGMIFIVILALMVLMQLLRFIGLERLIHSGLAPLLRVLGINQSAANVTVIGVALGLSYGAGLLIRDLDAGVMSQRDSFLALCFIGLVHSMIEDTLLIMALGADLSGILWARLFFSIAVIALLARCASGFSLGGGSGQTA